jgi:hypothetical protein
MVRYCLVGYPLRDGRGDKIQKGAAGPPKIIEEKKVI